MARSEPNHSDENQSPRSSLKRETAAMRNAILAGYRDANSGRMVEYQGNLRRLLNDVKKPSK
jgi:hypothetical protein